MTAAEAKPSQADYNALRKVRSNQHVASQTLARRQLQARDKIKIGMLLGKLHRAAEGKEELTTTQAMACKILIDKAIPSLQAVEQSTAEQEINAGAVAERLQAMLASPHILAAILSDPGIRAQLQAALAAAPVAVTQPLDPSVIPASA